MSIYNNKKWTSDFSSIFGLPDLSKSLSPKIAKSRQGGKLPPKGPSVIFFEYRHKMRQNEYIQPQIFFWRSDFSAKFRLFARFWAPRSPKFAKSKSPRAQRKSAPREAALGIYFFDLRSKFGLKSATCRFFPKFFFMPANQGA